MDDMYQLQVDGIVRTGQSYDAGGARNAAALLIEQGHAVAVVLNGTLQDSSPVLMGLCPDVVLTD